MEYEIDQINIIVMKKIRFFTDGHCPDNGKPNIEGAAAFIVVDESDKLVYSHYETEPDATNNRTEMRAVLSAMKYILNHYPSGAKCLICTDSAYVANGINDKWVEGWIKKGWKTSNGGEVMNQDLWKEMEALNSKVACRVIKVPRGNPFTRVADKLARTGKKGEVSYWFKEYLKTSRSYIRS